MFGETVEAACFAMLPGLQLADSAASIRRLVDGFKIAQ